jgi:ribA/ribD-fused uncharacterized protein
VGNPAVIPYFDDFECDNEYRFLSNFYVGEPIHFRQYVYATGEHMFQAFKARTRADHMKVIAQPTPAEAKGQGKHTLRLRPDWERIKYDVMRLVLACKFTPEREEGRLLLATGDALLVEGTTWGDRVWGVDLKAGRRSSAASSLMEGHWEPGEGWQVSPGRNWLGSLLMARRAEVHAELAGVRFSYATVAETCTTIPRPSEDR